MSPLVGAIGLSIAGSLGGLAAAALLLVLPQRTYSSLVKRLRELSPLWEMFQEGVDLKSVQWAAH